MTTGRLLTLVAICGFAGCHGATSPAANDPPTPVAGAAAAPKAGPTAGELAVGMVEAVTLGKSSVPVAVKFELPERPSVGHPTEIAIAVIPAAGAIAAVVQASGSDGLKVAPTPVTIPSVNPMQVYRVIIPITPTADGLQLLGLDVSLKHDDATDHRFFSVPILVTSSPAAAPGNAAADGKIASH